MEETVTPLNLASFLGRKRIIEYFLENPSLNLNLPTLENEYSPLCCASMAGQYEIVGDESYEEEQNEGNIFLMPQAEPGQGTQQYQLNLQAAPCQ